MSNAKELKLATARNDEILTAIKKGNVEKAVDLICQHLDENNGRYAVVTNEEGKGINTGVLVLENTTSFHCKVTLKGGLVEMRKYCFTLGLVMI